MLCSLRSQTKLLDNDDEKTSLKVKIHAQVNTNCAFDYVFKDIVQICQSGRKQRTYIAENAHDH